MQCHSVPSNKLKLDSFFLTLLGWGFPEDHTILSFERVGIRRDLALAMSPGHNLLSHPQVAAWCLASTDHCDEKFLQKLRPSV